MFSKRYHPDSGSARQGNGRNTATKKRAGYGIRRVVLKVSRQAERSGDEAPRRFGLGIGLAETVGEEGIKRDILLLEEALLRQVAIGQHV